MHEYMPRQLTSVLGIPRMTLSRYLRNVEGFPERFGLAMLKAVSAGREYKTRRREEKKAPARRLSSFSSGEERDTEQSPRAKGRVTATVTKLSSFSALRKRRSTTFWQGSLSV